MILSAQTKLAAYDGASVDDGALMDNACTCHVTSSLKVLNSLTVFHCCTRCEFIRTVLGEREHSWQAFEDCWLYRIRLGPIYQSVLKLVQQPVRVVVKRSMLCRYCCPHPINTADLLECPWSRSFHFSLKTPRLQSSFFDFCTNTLDWFPTAHYSRRPRKKKQTVTVLWLSPSDRQGGQC